MSNISLNYAQIIDPLSFKSINLAKIYIGEYGTLPNPANAATWKQAYFVNSDGTRTAASQPIRTNAAGFAVDGSGNIKTIQVDGGYSLLVQDQYGATKFSQACSASNSGAVLEFDTIAGFTGALDGSVCYFKGRDTVGDGGGGYLRFLAGSTATANGVTVYLVTSGRLEREGWSVFGVDVRWAGAKGDGVADDTVALQRALDTGAALNFGNLTYKHSGLTLTTTGGVFWRGDGARLVFTGASTADAVVVQAPTGSTATGCDIAGIVFEGGRYSLTVGGQANSIFKDVKVEKCKAKNSALSTFHFYHVDGLQVRGNTAELAGDVGIYTEFCRNVIVSGNLVRNCQGSAGLVVAYGDPVIAYGSTDELTNNAIISNNIVVCDDDAVAGNYIGGIQVNMISGANVFGNIIRNSQTAPAVDKSMRVGIVMSEWALKDVNINDNTILNMFQYGIRGGADTTTEIRRLRVSGNRISKCGLSGLYFERAFEGLEIVDNAIEFTQQHGIYLETTCYDALVANNSFRHVGIQNTFASVSGVYCGGRNYRVYDNRFYCGADAVVVTSTQTTPEYSVDPSTHTLTLRSGGATQATYNYNGKTFEDIRAWISAQTGWTAYFEHAELGKVDATHILRRTGPRTTSAVNNIPVSGFTFICSAEPQYLVNATGVEGDVRGNKWTSYAVDYADSFDGTAKMYAFGSDVMSDTNEYGARQFMASSPAALPGRTYVVGDRVTNSAPSVGQPKAWACTTRGKPGTWVSEGNL